MENMKEIKLKMSKNDYFGVYRHKKRGSYYVALGSALRESDRTPCIVYKSLRDGRSWVRPIEEFFDGRFELVTLNNEEPN